MDSHTKRRLRNQSEPKMAVGGMPVCHVLLAYNSCNFAQKQLKHHTTHLAILLLSLSQLDGAVVEGCGLPRQYNQSSASVY